MFMFTFRYESLSYSRYPGSKLICAICFFWNKKYDWWYFRNHIDRMKRHKSVHTATRNNIDLRIPTSLLVYYFICKTRYHMGALYNSEFWATAILMLKVLSMVGIDVVNVTALFSTFITCPWHEFLTLPNYLGKSEGTLRSGYL